MAPINAAEPVGFGSTLERTPAIVCIQFNEGFEMAHLLNRLKKDGIEVNAEGGYSIHNKDSSRVYIVLYQGTRPTEDQVAGARKFTLDEIGLKKPSWPRKQNYSNNFYRQVKAVLTGKDARWLPLLHYPLKRKTTSPVG